MKPAKTLVPGMVNTVVADEDSEIHALNLLQSFHSDRPNIAFIDGGTLNFTLAAYAVWFAPVIVVICAISTWPVASSCISL